MSVETLFFDAKKIKIKNSEVEIFMTSPRDLSLRSG